MIWNLPFKDENEYSKGASSSVYEPVIRTDDVKQTKRAKRP